MLTNASACRRPRCRAQMLWMFLLATALLALPSCASRVLLIESEPSGAEVVLDGRVVGITPVSVPFRYGGSSEVILLAAGCKPAIVFHDSARFWRDTPPFDAVTDLLAGSEQQVLRVTLDPEPSLAAWDADKDGLLRGLRERAAALKARAEAAILEAAPREAPPARRLAKVPSRTSLGAQEPLLIR